MTRIVSFEVIANSAQVETPPIDRDLAQWHQAVGVARQACARIFRDGGTSADAIRTFGLDATGAVVIDWSRAVAMIAESLCSNRIKRAA
jgi:hypothetical protein